MNYPTCLNLQKVQGRRKPQGAKGNNAPNISDDTKNVLLQKQNALLDFVKTFLKKTCRS